MKYKHFKQALLFKVGSFIMLLIISTTYSNLYQIFQIHLYQKKNGERDYASCLQSITEKTSQQLINACTTRDIHVHISCYAIAQQLLGDQRSYIFQLLLLYFHPNIRYCRKNCLPLWL